METKEKKHGIPALMSFFIPGLGQLIKGQVLKGFLIWLIPIVLLMIVMAQNSEMLLILFVIGCIVLWLWNIFDAYNSNKEQKTIQQNVQKVQILSVKEPTIDKSLIINQLEKIHGLKEKGVLNETQYEKERQELLAKLDSEKETKANEEKKIFQNIPQKENILLERRNDNRNSSMWALIIMLILLGGGFGYYFYSMNANTVKEKEVKSALIEAYFDITSPHEKLDTKEGIPLFNTDIGDMMLYSDMGLVMLQAKNVQFEPKNIEVKCLSEDSANVSYTLQILSNGVVSKTEGKTVLARKIGDRWKFDAKSFSPIESNNEDTGKHRKRKKEIQSSDTDSN